MIDAMKKQLDAAALTLAASGRARGRSAVVLVHNLRTQHQAGQLHVEARHVLHRAARLREQLRETVLRYGLRRLPLIRGGGADAADRDHRRLLIRTIAAHCHVPPRVGPSTGAICALCRGPIAPGAPQYDIQVGQSTVVVDEYCYNGFLRPILDSVLASIDADRSPS